MPKTKSMIRGAFIIAGTIIFVAIASSNSFAIGVPIHPPKPMKSQPSRAMKPLTPEGRDNVDMIVPNGKGKHGPINHGGEHLHPHFPHSEKCKDTPGIIGACKK